MPIVGKEAAFITKERPALQDPCVPTAPRSLTPPTVSPPKSRSPKPFRVWYNARMNTKKHSLGWGLALGLSLFGLFGSMGTAYADADRKTTMELVQLVTPKETYRGIVDQMTKQMLASMRQSGATLPPDVDKKMGQVIEIALPYEDLATWTVDIYVTRFTTDEIKQLIAFYKTPVGRKASKMIPEISGEVGQKMGPLLMQRLPEAMKKVGLTPR